MEFMWAGIGLGAVILGFGVAYYLELLGNAAVIKAQREEDD